MTHPDARRYTVATTPAILNGFTRAYGPQKCPKKKAHHIVTQAIKAGELVNPGICEHCFGDERKVFAHHEDYDKPLEVNWICRPCHFTRHKEMDDD